MLKKKELMNLKMIIIRKHRENGNKVYASRGYSNGQIANRDYTVKF